jgi:hypothetical protein
VLSLAVAGIVAAYGYRVLKQQQQVDDAAARSVAGPIARLFFVTFAATYVVAYAVERLSPVAKGLGMTGGGGAATGGMAHDHSAASGPSLADMLLRADTGRPNF